MILEKLEKHNRKTAPDFLMILNLRIILLFLGHLEFMFYLVRLPVKPYSSISRKQRVFYQ